VYNIKGFAVLNSLADNTTNVISPLGELSANALTYSREETKGHYYDPNKGEATFVSFDCRNEDNELEPVPLDYQGNILTLLNWLHDKALLGQIPTSNNTLVQNLTNEFGTVIENIQAGPIITSGSIRLPSWVSWSISAEPDGNRVKVWFSNTAFVTQYDQTTILVIPPVVEVDSLMGPSPDVQALVQSRDLAEFTEVVEATRGNSPYTYLKSFIYDRVSPIAPVIIPTNWTVLIYGIAGNNLDVIRQSFIDYILANTEFTREEWKLVLPSLFVSTEFIITPIWGKIAISNLTEAAGLFSPTLSLAEIQQHVQLTAPEYPQPHVLLNARVTGTPYKSISFTSVGSPENIDGITALDVKWADYINVPTSSPDFNRMDPDTQEWVQIIQTLLQAAETLTPFSDVPVGVGRVTRGDLLFASASYQGTQYLVATKYSVVP